MVVINYQDQLQPDTFEHAIHHLIDKRLDLSVFYPGYQNDDVGRPANDPSVLPKIILFAYSKGITTSREIAWCCNINIIFKVLSCDMAPHYTTIASFVSGHTVAIAELFEQVLLIRHEQGLLGNELFASVLETLCKSGQSRFIKKLIGTVDMASTYSIFLQPR